MKFVQGSRKGQRPRAYVEYRKDRRGSTDGFEMLLRCGFHYIRHRFVYCDGYSLEELPWFRGWMERHRGASTILYNSRGPRKQASKSGRGLFEMRKWFNQVHVPPLPPPPWSVEEKAVYMDREIRWREGPHTGAKIGLTYEKGFYNRAHAPPPFGFHSGVLYA